MKLKETKVLLTKAEDKQLEKIAKTDRRSKTNFCTNEIRKIIAKQAVPPKEEKLNGR